MGRRRGPTPSLLPAPASCPDQIEYDEVRRIMLASCWGKNAYASLYQARQIAATAEAKTHEQIQPYQCPFHTLRAERALAHRARAQPAPRGTDGARDPVVRTAS